MRILELLLARTCLAALDGLDSLWHQCVRCGEVRWRWHRHEPLPPAVVLQLHRGMGQGPEAVAASLERPSPWTPGGDLA